MYAFLTVNATKPDRGSVPDLAAGLIDDAQRLVHLEIALAKQEVKELAISNGLAAGMFAGAGLLAVLALLVALPVLLVVALPWHWQAALVWLLVYLAGAGALALIGKSKLKLEVPKRTLDSLKETKEWAVHQVRSSGR